MGAEDTQTKDQRYHDALEDAMRRLVASGLLPDRAGQPVKVRAHVSLAELRALDDGSVLAQEWIGEMAIRWAARRAAASQAGSDGAAWLTGKPAGAMACDATVIPVVTGQVDPGVLDDLVGLCLQYAGHGPHCAATPDPDPDPAAARPGGRSVRRRRARRRPGPGRRLHPHLRSVAAPARGKMPPCGAARPGTAGSAGRAPDHAHGPHRAIPNPGIHHALNAPHRHQTDRPVSPKGRCYATLGRSTLRHLSRARP